MEVRRSLPLPKSQQKQIHNLFSASFTPPILKSNDSSVLAKPPAAKLKSTRASTATTFEKSKSQVVVEEEPKKKNDGEVKVPRRVFTDEDEILLLREMSDSIKRGENPNSEVFYESFKPKISVNVTSEQIMSKIRHAKIRYNARVKKEKKERKGKVLKFPSPHLQKCHQLSKLIWGSGGEGSETVVAENEDEVGKSQRGKKRKAVTKDGNATGANDQLEEVDAVAENLEAATVEKQDGAATAEKQDGAGAGDVEATAIDGQEDGNQCEKEKNKKKKKKKKKRIEVGNADNVLEKSKPTHDNVSYQLMTQEQLTKAPLDLERSLNEKTIQSIEPSRMMAYLQKWKEIKIAEVEVFLKKNDLVREGSLMYLEALKAPPS